jgi:hypothetical protein
VVADPVILWISALAPAVILAMTSWKEITRPDDFRAAVGNYDLLPATLVAPVAYVLPFISLGAAACLTIPDYRAKSAVVAVLLLSVFTGAIAVNLARGRSGIDCGCHFGSPLPTLSGGLLMRNGLLIALLLPALITEKASRALAWLDWISIVSASAVFVTAYATLEELLARPALRAGGWGRR